MGKSLDIIKAPKQKPVTPNNVGDRTHEQDKDSFFNSEPKQEKSDPLLFYLILGLCAIILLVALSVWLIYRSLSGAGNSTSSSTSTSQSAKADDSKKEAPASSSTTTTSADESATTTVDKSSVKVRVLNGNGRSGEANLISQALKDDGFVNITTGNAAGRYSTTVIYYNTGKLAEAKAVEKVVSSKYEPTLKEDSSIAKTNDVVVALGDK